MQSLKLLLQVATNSKNHNFLKAGKRKQTFKRNEKALEYGVRMAGLQ